jgi:hypothetical protein
VFIRGESLLSRKAKVSLMSNIPHGNQIAVSFNEKGTVAIHQISDHVLGA